YSVFFTSDVDSPHLLSFPTRTLFRSDGQERGVAVLPLAGLLVLAAAVACDAEVGDGVPVVRVAQLRVCDEGCFGDGDLWKCHVCSLAFLGMKKARAGISPRGVRSAVCGRPVLF